MRLSVDQSLVALEKTRIANDGIIPEEWESVAEKFEHGRKWLKKQEAISRLRIDVRRANAAAIRARNTSTAATEQKESAEADLESADREARRARRCHKEALERLKNSRASAKTTEWLEKKAERTLVETTEKAAKTKGQSPNFFKMDLEDSIVAASTDARSHLSSVGNDNETPAVNSTLVKKNDEVRHSPRTVIPYFRS